MELVIHGNPKEAELGDIGFGWCEHEIAMYSNPKAVENVRQGLAKIPVPGRVNILFNDRASPIFALVKDHEIEAAKDDIVDGQLNLFIRNNTGAKSRHNPLTPWILMHRLHHSLHLGGFHRIANTASSNTRTIHVINKVEKELSEAAKMNGVLESSFAWLMSKGLTMRSARVNQLTPFDLDIAAELFAQLMITGDIKFKSAWDWKFDDLSQINGTRGAFGPRANGIFETKSMVIGKFQHFYVGHNQKELSAELLEQWDEIMLRYKPIIKETLLNELEIMKTIPNFI